MSLLLLLFFFIYQTMTEVLGDNNLVAVLVSVVGATLPCSKLGLLDSIVGVVRLSVSNGKVAVVCTCDAKVPEDEDEDGGNTRFDSVRLAFKHAQLRFFGRVGVTHFIPVGFLLDKELSCAAVLPVDRWLTVPEDAGLKVYMRCTRVAVRKFASLVEAKCSIGAVVDDGRVRAMVRRALSPPVRAPVPAPAPTTTVISETKKPVIATATVHCFPWAVITVQRPPKTVPENTETKTVPDTVAIVHHPAFPSAPRLPSGESNCSDGLVLAVNDVLMAARESRLRALLSQQEVKNQDTNELEQLLLEGEVQIAEGAFELINGFQYVLRRPLSDMEDCEDDLLVAARAVAKKFPSLFRHDGVPLAPCLGYVTDDRCYCLKNDSDDMSGHPTLDFPDDRFLTDMYTPQGRLAIRWFMEIVGRFEPGARQAVIAAIGNDKTIKSFFEKSESRAVNQPNGVFIEFPNVRRLASLVVIDKLSPLWKRTWTVSRPHLLRAAHAWMLMQNKLQDDAEFDAYGEL